MELWTVTSHVLIDYWLGAGECLVLHAEGVTSPPTVPVELCYHVEERQQQVYMRSKNHFQLLDIRHEL